MSEVESRFFETPIYIHNLLLRFMRLLFQTASSIDLDRDCFAIIRNDAMVVFGLMKAPIYTHNLLLRLLFHLLNPGYFFAQWDVTFTGWLGI